MPGISERARRKQTERALTLLPRETTVRAYAVGHAHARMSTGATVAVAMFLCVFVTAMAFGVIVYPGGLLLLYVYFAVRPPRGIAATDQGLVLLERSFLNGRPSKVLALGPGSALLSTEGTGKRVIVPMGPDRLTLKRSEYERLMRAVPGGSWPQPVVQPG